MLPLKKHKAYDYVFEGGVCDEKFNFVAGEYCEYPKTYGYLSCTKSYIPAEPVQIRHETVIFCGTLINVFGFALMHNLNRLWYLADHPETPYKFVFLENKILGNFKFFNVLEAAGLSKDRIEIIEHPTQFDKVIVPEQTLYWCSNFRIGVKKIFDYMRSLVKPGPYKKVYLSRSALKEELEVSMNEEYFENFYKKRGYEIVHPEQLPFTEQLSIMAGADEVTAMDGTLIYLTQFCKPETKVVILLRTNDPSPIMPICVSSTIQNCWIVEAHFNFLPATFDFGAELMGPSSCWRQYLEHEDIQHTPEEVSEDIHVKPVLYDYIWKWGKIASDIRTFTLPSHTTLRNYSLIDILYFINLFFCGNKIDKSLYPDRYEIDRLKEENNKLHEVFTLALSDYIKYRYESIKNLLEDENFNKPEIVYDEQVKYLKRLSRLENQLEKKTRLATSAADKQAGHE